MLHIAMFIISKFNLRFKY